jgi:hypothetical protein
MMAWVRVVALCVALVMGGTLAAWSQDTERWDRYLDRPRGPYRGQVVDAETKAPLVGAVVVALWRRDRVYPFHLVSENYAVRETVTNAEGQFFLVTKDVEDNAPRRTYHPEFLIFIPGYGSYPGQQVSPRGFTGGIFEHSGMLVELPRLEGREARRMHLRSISPSSFSDEPFKDLPELMRKVNEERAVVGLNPYLPVEK